MLVSRISTILYSEHSLWVSCSHPAVFGQRVDYTLAILGTKMIFSILK